MLTTRTPAGSVSPRSAKTFVHGKLRSSMSLFLRADPAEPVFREVLDRFYGGVPDAETDRLLGA